jgi:carboxypeptidase Q
MRAFRRTAAAVVVGVAVVGAGPRGAYDSDTARRLATAAQNGRAFDYARDLTGSIGARLTGSAAYARAVQWSVRQFADAGVTAILEPFSIPQSWERQRPARARIVAPIQQPVTLASLGWTPSLPEVGVEADVVIASAKSFSAADVRGRIVMAADGDATADFDRQLAAAGALAVLFQDADADNKIAARVRRFGGEVTPLPSATLARDDAALLRRLVKSGPVRLALDWANKITEGPVVIHNVIAELRGRERPTEWVLVGAHLDSWDFATGAQDNATGVAMVLEAARAIVALGQAPRRSIRFALWGGEEQGLLGSSAYVGAHQKELDRVVAVLNVDGGTGRILGWTTPGREDVQDDVRDLARALLRGLEATAVDRGMSYAFDSDGGPFLREGVPLLDLNVDDSRYEEIHHKATDTMDRVDAHNLTVGAAAVAVTAYAIADAPGRLAPRGARMHAP